MDEETQKKLLETSPGKSLRSKLLSAVSMKEFLQLIESKVAKEGNSTDELKFVSDFISILEKDVSQGC